MVAHFTCSMPPIRRSISSKTDVCSVHQVQRRHVLKRIEAIADRRSHTIAQRRTPGSTSHSVQALQEVPSENRARILTRQVYVHVEIHTDMTDPSKTTNWSYCSRSSESHTSGLMCTKPAHTNTGLDTCMCTHMSVHMIVRVHTFGEGWPDRALSIVVQNVLVGPARWGSSSVHRTRHRIAHKLRRETNLLFNDCFKQERVDRARIP